MTAPPVSRLYMDELLAPRRSLGRRGVLLLFVPWALVNLAFGTFFHLIGAPLVAPFLGLDFAALALAFWISFRQARRGLRVRVSAEHVEVAHETPRSSSVVWRTATAFTRVAVDNPGRRAARVRLENRGRRLTLGEALGPVERQAFADALQRAVAEARAERWPS